jgi:hypothetical protein
VPPLQSFSKPSASFQAIPAQANSGTMAYQRVDLRPYTPNGFHAIEVQHREMMTRSILRSTQVTHEDFAIVSIHHSHAMFFSLMQCGMWCKNFWRSTLISGVRDIQPSHLGQALVQFNCARDREMLVNHSLHSYGGVSFSLMRHNQDRN